MRRQRHGAHFRDKERVRRRFEGTNFFFSHVPQEVLFSFFSFAFRCSLEGRFEGSRAPFRGLPGSLARAKSGHFAKDILQKSTFAHAHFRNPVSSAPGCFQSASGTPLGPPWDPSWSPELSVRPSARAKTRLTFGIDSNFQLQALFLDLLSLSNEITIFRQNGHFVRE